MARIAIYAGHGGSDPGAVSDGRRESDLNLAISNSATAILRSWGYTVINNRTTDVDRSITADANLANDSNVQALVEVHLNSNHGTPGTGSEAFVSVRDTGPARNLASDILQRLAALGFRNRGVFTSVNANGQDTFGILRLTNMPAVLLEVAFINNPQDMARLVVADAAMAIAEGVRERYPLSGGGSGGGGTGGGGTGGSLPPYPGTALRVGSRGESVTQIQRCLNRVRVNHPSIGQLNEDGIFGPLTEASVMEFQRIFGLAVDGVVGPLTWAALTRECAPTPPTPPAPPTPPPPPPTPGPMPPYPGVAQRQGMQGEAVRQIQRCLNRVATRQPAMGQLNEDGIFSQHTWCAVTTFQRLFGLNVDGVVGPLTWAALTRECA